MIFVHWLFVLIIIPTERQVKQFTSLILNMAMAQRIQVILKHKTKLSKWSWTFCSKYYIFLKLLLGENKKKSVYCLLLRGNIIPISRECKSWGIILSFIKYCCRDTENAQCVAELTQKISNLEFKVKKNPIIFLNLEFKVKIIRPLSLLWRSWI